MKRLARLIAHEGSVLASATAGLEWTLHAGHWPRWHVGGFL